MFWSVYFFILGAFDLKMIPTHREAVTGIGRDLSTAEAVTGTGRDLSTTKAVTGTRRDLSTTEVVTGTGQDLSITEAVTGSGQDLSTTESRPTNTLSKGFAVKFTKLKYNECNTFEYLLYHIF